MRLKDCLESDAVVSAPLARKAPDDSWLSAYKDKSIPESLYKFYVTTEYFSFDKCPKFLRDEQKLLFPHLEAAIDLIKLSFEEYYELINLMKKYDSDSYTPFKKIKGEKFDKSAPKHFNRYFQILIINMYSILDSIAEAITIILSWGDLGRSQFSSLVKSVKDNLKKKAPSIKIVTLEDNYIEKIKNIIEEEIVKDNNEWYELFKLYRNKQSHFRRYSGFLLHDKQGRFYHFLPRQWPYYFQQDISYAEGTKAKRNLKEAISELIMEQDIFEYCDGLHKKIYNLTNRIFNVLIEAYNIKKNSGCDINPDVQKKVALLKRQYKFKHF
jgi:hypothetical protein